jgi:hypothetical protein
LVVRNILAWEHTNKGQSSLNPIRIVHYTSKHTLDILEPVGEELLHQAGKPAA